MYIYIHIHHVRLSTTSVNTHTHTYDIYTHREEIPELRQRTIELLGPACSAASESLVSPPIPKILIKKRVWAPPPSAPSKSTSTTSSVTSAWLNKPKSIEPKYASSLEPRNMVSLPASSISGGGNTGLSSSSSGMFTTRAPGAVNTGYKTGSPGLASSGTAASIKEETDEEKFARGSRYLQLVKDTFSDRQHISLKFMTILTMYQAKHLSVDQAVEEVHKLFDGYPSLFDQFLGFVGPSYTGHRVPSYAQNNVNVASATPSTSSQNYQVTQTQDISFSPFWTLFMFSFSFACDFFFVFCLCMLDAFHGRREPTYPQTLPATDTIVPS